MTSWFSHLSWAQNTAAGEAIDAEIPWIFFCVFGIPLFMTMVYLMLQLTRPDRGGRVDVEVLQKASEEKDDTEDETDSA